jgi:hypothetical protein
MLRTMLIACALGAAMPAAAFAEQARQPVGLEVRDEQTGAVSGRVADVQRDERGRIVSVRVQGLEAPASAPMYVLAPRPPASAPVIAVQDDDGFRIAQIGRTAAGRSLAR